MAKILSDGTVLSSALSAEPKTKAGQIYRQDYALHLGTVTAIYYADDKNSITKKFVEYDVVVTDERPDGSSSTVKYSHCQTIDRFGAPNNYEVFTLQPNAEKSNGRYKKGAQVLVLCVNGNGIAGKAVIVGGMSYPLAKKPNKADGQFYESQFNGINTRIDKDGQYSLTFNTVIDVDGKKADEKAAGTKLEIFKNGRLKISDNEGQYWEIDREKKIATWTNGSDFIVINKKDKKIEITSTGDMNETIAKAKTVTVKEKDHSIETSSGSIKEKSGKDIEQDAKANIKQKAGANWTFEAGGNINIKSGANVMIQAGAMAQLKGTITLIGEGSVPAAGVGISQSIGVGNLGIPVLSTIITGSATVLIGT